MIKAFIFDLDGTLTDTEKFYQKAWPEALQHFGYKCEPWMPLELRSLGRPFAPIKFREWFGEDFDYDKVRAYRKQLIEEYLKPGIPLKPGAVEVLTFLREKGFTVAMATANDLERTTRYLERIGLLDCFDKIICADMVKQGKPAPDIYKYACDSLGLPPDQTVAVEDSPNGIRSAAGAGCRTVMIPDLTEPDEELSKLLWARVDKLEDLKTLIHQ
ncbi:MAG: HAD family phosphatase [Clostridiales bacterium]|nr:HAD family phosphatase [Clostridiales bacterium]